jgi:NitT/TauT family transport system substrate-binding protein
MVVWPGYLPLIIADHLGYFKEAGLNVEIKRYDALSEISKDYVSGKLQGRANLTLDMINEYLEGLDHKVILVIDYSNGADAIMAREDIQSLKDVQGKKVAYESNTLEEFFLTWVLNEENLSISDVESVPANPEEAAKLLQEGKVDVGVSYEPFISKLTASHNFHTLYSSKQAPGLIADVLTFRSDFLKAYPETVEVFVKAYFRGLQFWKQHPENALAILAKEFGTTPEDVNHQLSGVAILDEKDNQTAFTFAAGFQSLYGNLRFLGSFVKQHRNINSHLDTDQLIERRFIKYAVPRD